VCHVKVLVIRLCVLNVLLVLILERMVNVILEIAKSLLLFLICCNNLVYLLFVKNVMMDMEFNNLRVRI